MIAKYKFIAGLLVASLFARFRAMRLQVLGW